MAFEFEVLTADTRKKYELNNDNVWTVSIDHEKGWILFKLPKHPQQYMYGDYADHFVLYFKDEIVINFSIYPEVETTNGVDVYSWLNLHAFSGWDSIGKETAIQLLKEALIAYGAGSREDNKRPHLVQFFLNKEEG